MNIELRDIKGELVDEFIIMRGEDDEPFGALKRGNTVYVYVSTADGFPHTTTNGPIHLYKEVEIYEMPSHAPSESASSDR